MCDGQHDETKQAGFAFLFGFGLEPAKVADLAKQPARAVRRKGMAHSVFFSLIDLAKATAF